MLADLQTWRESLRKARIAGVRSVRDASGETIEYKSDLEMERALRFCDQLIAEQSSGAAPNVIKFQTVPRHRV